MIIRLRICIVAFILVGLSFFLFSFIAKKTSDDFFSMLGIEKTAADRIITSSMLGGYFNAYGFKNAKNIAIGNRPAIAKDILEYAKKYYSTDAFKSEYNQLKQKNKPELRKIETPEEMQRNLVDRYQKSVTDMENTIKKADANTKTIFENMLVEMKKQLKIVEDPNSQMIKNYADSYNQMLETNQQVYAQQLRDWELNFPANENLFVQKRLVLFLEETKDIDYNAALTEKNGKKIFVNEFYEHKGNYWKMAFRAGKDVAEPSREYVQHWLNEIK